MKIAVTDANIFIDLLLLGRIEGLFLLGLEVVTTREVMDELIQDQLTALLPFLLSGQLTVHVLSDDVYATLDQKIISKKLSFSDKSALVLAQQLNAMVLTGDNLLRKKAIARAIEAHGMLWILEQWVTLQWIDTGEAAALLQQLMYFNERMPKKECQDLLRKWGIE
jgi:predicted nucleic acid-binding protein